MKGHGAKYDRKKEEAIAELLTQKNIEEAARSIGIGSATLLRCRTTAKHPMSRGAADAT